MNEKQKKLLKEKYASSPRGWLKWLTASFNKELYNSLLEEYKEKPKAIKEKMYWLFNDLKEVPKCKTCGKGTSFIDGRRGYRKFCSCRCAQLDKEVREKLKQTMLKKYGVDNAAKSDYFQQKMKQSCLLKYGAENVFASEYGKIKLKQTMLKKYGVDNAQKNKTIAEKTKQTMLKKYGVNCGCKLAKNKRTSNGEIELYNFIKENYKDAIHNDYSAIGPFELDIFIPSLRLGIEYDGDYWHNLPNMIRRDKRKNYVCYKNNIKLIRIKESEWKNNDKIKEKILEEING